MKLCIRKKNHDVRKLKKELRPTTGHDGPKKAGRLLEQVNKRDDAFRTDDFRRAAAEIQMRSNRLKRFVPVVVWTGKFDRTFCHGRERGRTHTRLLGRVVYTHTGKAIGRPS